MKTIKELEADVTAARDARSEAENRISRVDRLLAAMTLIDDSLGDGPWLGRAIVEAINKADNAQAFAELTSIRKAILGRIPILSAAVKDAERALNDAPEEAA